MADDFSTLHSSISAALVATTRSATALANEDLSFHRSLDPSLAAQLDRQNAHLLGLATGLLGTAAATTETVRPPPSLRDIEGIENNWRAVVDVVDSLLERADTALDEFTGAVKRLSPSADSQAGGTKAPKPSKIAMQLKAQEMQKPQILFEQVPTNREERPFRPLLQEKPHATVPLTTSPVPLDGSDQPQCPHPYQTEIEQYQYPPTIYEESDPIPYHPFDSTTATLVDTEEELAEMVKELKKAKEIAVDLEHHDLRSYIGIVSLMQISTRDRDWIVDTLKPWRQKLQVLNEVFADPKIIKVLHGAYMDVVWLQRDLGLYLVGLFDTHYAARSLGYAGGSLAFLLKKFANVDAQKQYQMADWRVRPLPSELFDYARSDTHYLLYIFDCMRNELIQRSNFSLPDHEGDKLWHVLQKSSDTALQRYEHPTYDIELGQGSSGWYKMLTRTPALFDKEQFSVFRAVHKWRDNVAREQDDSVHYVMPNHQIFSIAREMPVNRATMLGIAQPTTQTVRLRADELVAVILNAKEAGKDGPDMLEILNKVEPHTSAGMVKRQHASHAVGSFLSKSTSDRAVNGQTSTDVSSLPLRTTTSAFWGTSFENSSHEQTQRRSMSTATESIQMSIPMPALTAEVFTDSHDSHLQTPVRDTSPIPAPEPTSPQAGEKNGVFILKELGKKRKRATADAERNQSDGMALQSDEVALPDEELERAREKDERKKAWKEAKRAAKREKAGEAQAEAKGDRGEEDEPFEYASAPSILNPPRETKEQMKERRKKEINPYTKALDTPRGLPRVQKERAGRSITYK